MPTFDFNRTQTNNSAGTGTRSVTDTYTAGLNTVTFTLSSTDADSKSVQIGGNTGPFGMGLRDNGSDNVFTLAFQSTAVPANTVISADATNPITVGNGQFVIGSWNVSFLTTGGGTVFGGTITAGGQNVSNTSLTNVDGIRFTSLSGAASDILEFDNLSFKGMNCFTAGTLITTPEGPRTVETLVPGDFVLTADGRKAEVKWLGRQPVNVRLLHPAKINPVRISAGALGGGLPERDLLISPDHAIAMDGMLINAGALANGSTIRQEPKMPMDGFTYYHVETDAHELLLAEGVAAETFIDYAGRETFENGGESTAHIPEMDLPRISSARLVPDHIRARLAPAIAAE